LKEVRRVKSEEKEAVWSLFAKWKSRDVAVLIVAAAVEVVLMQVWPLNYGPFEFRFADAMLPLFTICWGYVGALGIFLGSQLMDVIFGIGVFDLEISLGLLVCWMIPMVELVKHFGRKDWVYHIACLWASFVTGLWIGWMLSYLFNLPFLEMFAYITIATAVMTNGIGYIIYKALMSRIKKFIPDTPWDRKNKKEQS
jgi:hypothetical protein